MINKQLYVSRDKKGVQVYALWDNRPRWAKTPSIYTHANKPMQQEDICVLLTAQEYATLFPRLNLEPGQLAKVERNIAEGCTGLPDVAVFTLGEIVEDHGEK